MYKTLYALLGSLLLFSASVAAQEIKINAIAYQVLVPKGNSGIQSKHYQTLADRIKLHLNNTVSFSNQSSFCIVPEIHLLSDMTAGEVQDTKVLKLEFVFSLQNPDLEVTFHTFSKKVIVTAENTDLAIQKAIREIRPNDKNLVAFLQNGEQLIKKFYNDNCTQIMQSAQVKIDRKEYNAAFSLLRYVPEQLACSKDIESTITGIYQHYKDEYCSKQLHIAQTKASKEEYDSALSILQYIDPRATCHNEVSILLQQIADKVTQETIRKFEMNKTIFEKNSEMEKMKILVQHVDEIALHLHD